MARLPRLPDLLTTANLSCGVGSILLASQGQLTWACWLVFAGAAFDVLDGLTARALGGGSEFGKQLDSLADMVTFGVAPGIILVFALGWPDQHTYDGSIHWSAFSPLLIPIASAWRLAKFNIDTQQSHGFLGLATPFNAMFWASLVLGSMGAGVFQGPLVIGLQDVLNGFLHIGPWMPIAVLGLSVLMLSSIPLPSLKFKHFNWKGNEVIYCLLATGICLLPLYGILAVPLILLLYLLSPLWGRLFPENASPQRHGEHREE